MTGASTFNPKALPSVDDVKPIEEGGPAARSGFNYQDEVAVGFMIEMLETGSLLKVHCETHDDIVLVREVNSSEKRLAEFVQVKASEQDKLWSVADLCAQKKGKGGTSILEASLARDKHIEESRFRIVTLRPVVSDLKILTFPFGSHSREPELDNFKNLRSEIDSRFPGLESPKGNGIMFWLTNCFWDERHSENSIYRDNLYRLLKVALKEGRSVPLDLTEVLIDELRAWAKRAGAAKWDPDREQKIITREMVRGWWERRTSELIQSATKFAGGKLAEKMAEAGLTSEVIELAVDMRRDYAAVARTSRYMEPDEIEKLTYRVKSEVQSLRSRLIAGQLDLDGAGFHALCIDRMDVVNAERPNGREDRSAFLKGCMYDIADRCLLRFARSVP